MTAKQFRSRAVTTLVTAWIVTGVVAGIQRGEITTSSHKTCEQGWTIVETIVAGPANYYGSHPLVTSCRPPHPSN